MSRIVTTSNKRSRHVYIIRLNGTSRCNFAFIYFGKFDFTSKPFFHFIFFLRATRLALCFLASVSVFAVGQFFISNSTN